MTFDQIREALKAQAAPFAPDKLAAVGGLAQACSFIIQEAARLRQGILVMSEADVSRNRAELRKSLALFAERLPQAQAELRELMKAEELQK